MPRKPLIYTHEYPYHIVARSNNQEWFKVNLDEVWQIFTTELTSLSLKYQFRIHCFVLMSNHYHLMASCSKNYNLGFIMRILQSKTSRKINSASGRINHVYGSRYRASLIDKEYYYAAALKYVLRNPIAAQACKNINDWKYSTLGAALNEKSDAIPLSSHAQFSRLVGDMPYKDRFQWLNQSFTENTHENIRRTIQKSTFRFRQSKSPPTHPL